MKPTYLYHKSEEPRIFDADTDDMQALHEAGWRDSPDAAMAISEAPEGSGNENPDDKPVTRKGKA